ARVGVAGQMVDLLRLNFAQERFETETIAQITAPQNDALRQVPQLGRPLSSPARAEQLDAALFEQRLCQVAAREPGNSGQQNTHGSSTIRSPSSVVHTRPHPPIPPSRPAERATGW